MIAAIILAGGKGTRLGEVHPPKALVSLNGKTLLDWQLDWVLPLFDVVVLALGHRAEEIKVHVQKKGYAVEFSVEQELLGTGGAVKLAYEKCQGADRVYVLNVDDLARVDVSVLGSQTPCVVCRQVPFSVWAGEKLYSQNETRQHIGHTLLSKEDIIQLPVKGNLEQWLAARSGVKQFLHGGEWVTINSLAQLRAAEVLWK
ncbi:NTP transferase domain-containing protein [Candidatus Woesearchaeota archaeon]|nr:NTP transferase domain-containing protein [Candidatus Woesearchaeota archaeon]